MVEAINILERCGGQLGWKFVVQSDRERPSLLEHRIRLRTFVLVLVVISYLRENKTNRKIVVITREFEILRVVLAGILLARNDSRRETNIAKIYV